MEHDQCYSMATPPIRTLKLPRWIPYSFAAAAVGSLSFVSYLLWREVQEQFPKLPPGQYIGELSEVLSEKTPFFVKRDAERDELEIMVLKGGWQPKLVVPVERGIDGVPSVENSLPILISGAEARLKLVGAPISEGKYGGVVYDTNSGREGEWNLRAIPPPEALSEEAVSNISLWLSLRSDLAGVERALESLERTIDTQGQEILQLNDFITEGSQLKKNADVKFAAETQKLQEVLGALRKTTQEREALKKQYDIAQKLTPGGRLASLAREAAEREDRWLEAVLQDAPEALNVEDNEALKKGEEIARLRREIDAEKEKIEDISRNQADSSAHAPSSDSQEEAEE